MSNSPDSAQAPVVGLTEDFTPLRRLPAHTHRKAQLLYTTSGVMLLDTEEGHWVLPPHRALWIPPRVEHSLSCKKPIRVHALYVRSDWVQFAHTGCRVLEVAPLLRELILRAVTVRWSYDQHSPEWRLMQVLADELIDLDAAPLHLPLPKDPRALRLVERLRQNPADRASLAQWASAVGASERTLARLFRAETGMTFGLWRQQMRLNIAIERLAQGHTVTSVALDLGYDTTSGFIAAFKSVFRTTPGAYFS